MSSQLPSRSNQLSEVVAVKYISQKQYLRKNRLSNRRNNSVKVNTSQDLFRYTTFRVQTDIYSLRIDKSGEA